MSKKLMLIAAAIFSLSLSAMAQGNPPPAAGDQKPAAEKPVKKEKKAKAKKVAKKKAKKDDKKADAAAPTAAAPAQPK